MPPLEGARCLSLKEITLKSHNPKNLQDIHNRIKEAIKLVKQKESQEVKPADAREEDAHLAFEELTKSNKMTAILKDIIIRPAIAAKKTIGQLECHMNGFRFLSSKGQKVDITFNNIRNAFF